MTLPVYGELEDRSLRTEAATLAHELGHALYGLPDTYVFDVSGGDTDGPVRSAYPSCASGPEQAQDWFGDLVGTTDPSVEEWLAAYDRQGIPLAPEEAEVVRSQVRVDLVPDGCFGPEGVAVRSSRAALMHSSYEVPLLDAVERRWAEQVLDAWAHRDP